MVGYFAEYSLFSEYHRPSPFRFKQTFLGDSRSYFKQELVQPSIRYRLVTKPFELFFEMQDAALDISDHRIIG